ncbi:MAG: flagellar hook-basal body complex protein FliE [Betaproteobacteria bacterium]|jgi:flagellar hook-basal body complex protein FliE|nr:flagellar hook-basal body complex protein FliE [Betaproteobacteria bacterium]
MTISALSSLLSQMHTTASAASGQATTGSGGPDFANLLQHSIDQIAQSQNQATQLSQQFALGNSSVSLSDAMMSVQKASITLQTGVQIRNKLVTAYNDIMNMQV